MDDCQKYIELLSSGSYQSMSPSEKKEIEQQLKQDADCFERFEKMKKTLMIIKENKTPDPGAEYWDSFYDRMETRLDSENNKTRNWTLLFRAAAFIVAGIFIGYLLFDKPNELAVENSVQNSDTRQAALARETADMLEETKVLILGIANFSTPDSSSEQIDFSFQKEISNTLLLQTADLKKQLAKSKNRRVINLLNDLEIILLQIANLEEKFDLQAIEMIRDGANNQSILFKINMERMLLEARKEQQKDQPDTKPRKES